MTEKTSSIIGGSSHIAPTRRFWTPGKIIFLVILLGGIAAGGYFGYVKFMAKKSDVTQVPTFKVKKTDFEISVTEEGTLQSMKSHNIKGDFQANAKIEWIVPEETVVKKGDVVLRFDVTEVQTRIDDGEVRVREAESALVRAKEDDLIAIREDEATINSATKDIETSKADLDKFLNSDVPARKNDFLMTIRQSRQALRDIETEYADLPFLIERELKTLNDLEKTKIRLEGAKNNLRKAEDGYRVYLEYELPRTLASKQDSVENNIRKLERTKNNIDSRAAQRLSGIRQAERNLDNSKKRLDEDKKTVEKMILKAPTDGMILYGGGEDDENNWRWGNSDEIKDQLKPGTSIWANQPLLNIPDTSKMKVTVSILEADISKIAINLPCYITVPALDNAQYTGLVSTKARSARGIRPWDPTSPKVVPIEITVEQYDPRLTPGSTVTAKILVKKMLGVLAVPVECVFEKDGHPVVYLKTGEPDLCEARRVKLGENNNSFVMIEAGLKEGDEIFQYAPTSSVNAPTTGENYKATPPPLPSPSPTPSVNPNAPPSDDGGSTPSGDGGDRPRRGRGDRIR